MTKVKQMELYKEILKDYPDVLTADEMCEALGICIKTGYKLLQENKIQYMRVGNNYRIAKIHLLSFLKVNLLPV